MRRLQSVLRRVFTTAWLHASARLLLLFRSPSRARAQLLRLVTLKPASFAAHRQLGSIALRMGRQQEALQEFAICHRLDPDRFMRLTLPPVFLDEVTSRSLDLPETPMFDLPPAEAGPLPGEWDDLMAVGHDEEFRDLAPEGTDFVDHEEFRRFRDLPPIAREDLEEVDINELLARLVEDPHPGGARDQF